MEHGPFHLQMVCIDFTYCIFNPVIFHSYVELPEGRELKIQKTFEILMVEVCVNYTWMDVHLMIHNWLLHP